jgi:hypothetical protein
VGLGVHPKRLEKKDLLNCKNARPSLLFFFSHHVKTQAASTSALPCRFGLLLILSPQGGVISDLFFNVSNATFQGEHE